MLKTPDLESEPKTAVKCWSLGEREQRLVQPGRFRTDVGATARILRGFPNDNRKNPRKRCRCDDGIRNEAATSGPGALKNPNGKTPHGVLTPWPRPVPQAVETKPCDKASGRLKARPGIVSHDDDTKYLWGPPICQAGRPRGHTPARRKKTEKTWIFRRFCPRRLGCLERPCRGSLSIGRPRRRFRCDSCIRIDRYQTQGFPDRQAAHASGHWWPGREATPRPDSRQRGQSDGWRNNNTTVCWVAHADDSHGRRAGPLTLLASRMGGHDVARGSRCGPGRIHREPQARPRHIHRIVESGIDLV